MELLEQRLVSRKTPRDGKLEITAASARRLEQLAQPVAVEFEGASATAALTAMPCTCRGGEQPHIHHFLEADLFKTLRGSEAIVLYVEARSERVHVSRVPAGEA